MAELRVQRRRPNVWRWIVLLLLIALLVWAIVELFGGEDSSVIETNPIGVRLAPGALIVAGAPLETAVTAGAALG